MRASCSGCATLGHDVTVIGNTGDDITLLGLRICPDLDTVMYTLGGGISADRGWGREDESFRVRDELAAYADAVEDSGVPSWFGLGDLDLATHLLRTRWLAAGVHAVGGDPTALRPLAAGVRLLPATDTPVETHVVPGRRHAPSTSRSGGSGCTPRVPATGFEVVGAATAEPAPGVVAALSEADVVLLPPSNPVVSVGVILAVPGIRDALRRRAAPVVGLSPIIGGAPVRGMADACLSAIGVETTAAAVAAHYGARSDGGMLDGWLVDPVDAAVVEAADGTDGFGRHC